ncbi:MAG: protein kinase [Lentisphaeraceae bacterium]|nr:protein kinase [Lentisphaeraceae bacterium]
MNGDNREHKIDFAGYFDLAKAAGQEDPENLQEHELLTPLKENKDRYSGINDFNQGGMKQILSGHDSFSGRNIAIAKMLDCNDSDDLELFLREARITACLEHPNIMPVYDISLDKEGLPFFTMKLIHGEDLGEILKNIKKNDAQYSEKYRLAALLEIFMKICDAIAYAHSRGVIHLDLKPDNIKISGFGEVIVCDWGLARLIDDADPELLMKDGVAGPLADINRTINGAVKGTPGYMSPEQATAQNNQKNHLTDVYSLGAILYSMLTLEKPITGKDTTDILLKTAKGDFLAPQKRAPERKIPYSLEAVVMKAMALKPEDRYESVEALQNEVRAYQEGFATEAENAPFHRLLMLLFKRHAALSVLTSAAIVVITLTTYSFLQRIEENKIRLEKAEKKSQEEQTKRESLSKDAAEIFLQQAFQHLARKDYDLALTDLNKSLALKPESPQGLELKAILLIGSLKFNEAKQTAEKMKEYTNQYFIGIANKYGPLLNEKQLLSPEDFLNLVSEIQDDRLLEEQGDYEKFKHRVSAYIENQLSNYSFQKYSLKDRIEMLKEMLELTNPQSEEIQMLLKSDANYILQLSITNNSELTSAEALDGLPIKNLDLSNTGIQSLDFTKHMPLNKLDISGTTIHNLSPLEHLPLQELNLNKTPVTDVSSIMKLPLKTIHLGSVKVSPLNLMNIFPYLETLYLPSGLYNENEINLLNKNIKINFE